MNVGPVVVAAYTSGAAAVPEPCSLALMLGGLGALGWRRRRRS
jgi:hypothetical protein